MNLEICKIDVKENEVEALEFLNSCGIFERGRILNLKKEDWFPKLIHHIRLHRAETYVDGKYEYGYYYTYVAKDTKHRGQLLEDVTFDQLKEFISKTKYYAEHNRRNRKNQIRS